MSDGSGVYLEPYCGKDTDILNQGMGQGPNVVIDLVEKVGVCAGSELYFDNLFTSFPLLDKLSIKEIGGTGTFGKNKLNNIPIKKQELDQKTTLWGTTDVLYNGDQALVGWRDSHAVYMASNKYNGTISGTCARFRRKRKSR